MATVAVNFEVLCETKFGESVVVVGSDPVTGAWSPHVSKVKLVTDPGSYPLWRGTVELLRGQQLLYKYVVLSPNAVCWESTPNRSAEVSQAATFCQTFNSLEEKVLLTPSPEVDAAPSQCKLALSLERREVLHQVLECPSPSKGARGHQKREIEDHAPPHHAGSKITFSVRAETKLGERLLVVGSDPTVGSWTPISSQVELVTDAESYPLWRGDCALPTGCHLFKFVVVGPDGSSRWEQTPNRFLEVVAVDMKVHSTFNCLDWEVYVPEVTMPQEAAAALTEAQVCAPKEPQPEEAAMVSTEVLAPWEEEAEETSTSMTEELAASCIQRWWRSELEWRCTFFELTVEEMLELRAYAAEEIQRVWRGHKVRASPAAGVISWHHSLETSAINPVTRF